MSVIYVNGGPRLQGEICLQGSKNTVLPMLAASILNQGSIRLRHCPQITDVDHMAVLLEQMGCVIKREHGDIEIDASFLNSDQVASEYGKLMRSSLFLLGPMLGRLKRAVTPYPGGCTIGARPIDIHLEAFRKMQVEIDQEEEYLSLFTAGLKGSHIRLAFPSVGATENVIMAAVLAQGTTWIENAAREPEVRELCLLLKAMGALISGEGTSCIKIKGVPRLHDAEYTIKGDRIAAGTYLAAAAATRGSVVLRTDCACHMEGIFKALEQTGARLSRGEDFIALEAENRPLPLEHLVTEPYPDFPTDMQSQMMAVLLRARGTSVIEEKIFESRFRICPDLCRMGADIRVEGRKARIFGVESLTGAELTAQELRGGAALIIAALSAEGESRIEGVGYIERGYEDICGTLSMLGAQIRQEK